MTKQNKQNGTQETNGCNIGKRMRLIAEILNNAHITPGIDEISPEIAEMLNSCIPGIVDKLDGRSGMPGLDNDMPGRGNIPIPDGPRGLYEINPSGIYDIPERKGIHEMPDELKSMLGLCGIAGLCDLLEMIANKESQSCDCGKCIQCIKTRWEEDGNVNFVIKETDTDQTFILKQHHHDI